MNSISETARSRLNALMTISVRQFTFSVMDQLDDSTDCRRFFWVKLQGRPLGLTFLSDMAGVQILRFSWP